MSIKIDPKGPRRSKKDPVRVRKLRQTSQAAFAASSFSSWLNLMLCKCIISWDSQLPWVFSREGGWNIVPHGHPRIWHIRPDGGRSVSSAQESSRLGGLARSVGLARWSRFWGSVVMEISQIFRRLILSSWILSVIAQVGNFNTENTPIKGPSEVINWWYDS